MNYGVIFLTGLTSGALSCLALQGGLLASAIAAQKQHSAKTETVHSPPSFATPELIPTGAFLLSKLFVHTLLGFFLGWLGSVMQLSLSARLFFQLLAALFLLATAANLMELHPFFRWIVLQPPRWFQRLVRQQSTGSSWIAPILLGAATVLIPCGVTQSMEVLAMTSGSPWLGAGILFVFVLGTSPLFALIGVMTATFSDAFQSRFRQVVSVLLVFLALSSINGVFTVLDFPFTWQKIGGSVSYFFSDQRIQDNLQQQKITSLVIPGADGVQRFTIQALSSGYSPRFIQVKAGQPVELTVQTQNTYSCASLFVFSAFNIHFELGPNDRKTAFFTPTQPGTYQFSCSMGMFTGTLEVL